MHVYDQGLSLCDQGEPARYGFDLGPRGAPRSQGVTQDAGHGRFIARGIGRAHGHKGTCQLDQRTDIYVSLHRPDRHLGTLDRGGALG